ncbi:family 43 glycosylhydrolase [Amycolatopsis magusensis]|uniref:family 43 glycosylhydrolase n=1 Tax=Amycolatopsis magusensis TaxID=882444 RepID=UPI001AE47A70|nr:family 43 glycosylhydrolase [Amycolatopsis magusensis]
MGAGVPPARQRDGRHAKPDHHPTVQSVHHQGNTADYKLGLLTFTGTDPLNRAHWTKAPNPVFQRNDAHGVFAPGHNGFFKSPDGKEDWIVYHADGTPNFGTPVPLGVQLPAPSGEPG